MQGPSAGSSKPYAEARKGEGEGEDGGARVSVARVHPPNAPARTDACGRVETCAGQADVDKGDVDDPGKTSVDMHEDAGDRARVSPSPAHLLRAVVRTDASGLVETRAQTRGDKKGPSTGFRKPSADTREGDGSGVRVSAAPPTHALTTMARTDVSRGDGDGARQVDDKEGTSAGLGNSSDDARKNKGESARVSTAHTKPPNVFKRTDECVLRKTRAQQMSDENGAGARSTKRPGSALGNDDDDDRAHVSAIPVPELWARKNQLILMSAAFRASGLGCNACSSGGQQTARRLRCGHAACRQARGRGQRRKRQCCAHAPAHCACTYSWTRA